MPIHDRNAANSAYDIKRVCDRNAANSNYDHRLVHEVNAANTRNVVWTAVPDYIYNNGFQTDGVTSLTTYRPAGVATAATYNTNGQIKVETANNNSTSGGAIRSNAINMTDMKQLVVSGSWWRRRTYGFHSWGRLCVCITVSQSTSHTWSGNMEGYNAIYLNGTRNHYQLIDGRGEVDRDIPASSGGFNPTLDVSGLTGNWYVHVGAFSFVAYGYVNINSIRVTS